MNDAAFFASLRSDQLHSEDVLGVGSNFIRRLRQLHAASFSTPAGVNLSFDYDYRSAQPLRGCACFVFFVNHFAARNWHAKFREDCLGLILMNLHVG
jgi:hypothetical protein